MERMQLLLNSVYGRVSNTRPVGRSCPSRACCAARDAFSEFSNNYHLGYSLYSPVLSARLASEQVRFERTYNGLGINSL